MSEHFDELVIRLAAYRTARVEFARAVGLYNAKKAELSESEELRAEALDALKVYEMAGGRLAYWFEKGLAYGLIDISPTDRDCITREAGE